MNLRRPIKFEIGNDKLSLQITQKRAKKDKKGSPIDIEVLSILIVRKKEEKGETIYFPEISKEESEKVFSKFEITSNKIGKLNRLAELTYIDIKKVIKLYLELFDLEKVLNRNAKCRSLSSYNFEKDLSFAESRNLLSCILKTDLDYQKSINLSKDQLKYFTKLFDGYIIDRDCYTHGELFFLHPHFDPLLRVTPPNSEEHYIEFSDKTYNDNMDTYNYIESFLRNFEGYLRKKKHSLNN